jgi:hypothetical protein
MPPAPTLLLTLALTACAAGTATRAPQAASTQGVKRADASVHTVERADSRLGPPSVRGLSLRRVDRPSSAEPPIALY